MKLLRLYARVIGLLSREAGLAWTLAVANLALACAQFAEPVLFGRVIDTLSHAQAGVPLVWATLMTLLLAWLAFGIFNIICSTLVALYADKLAHRQRHCVLNDYFEHVLQLPLAYQSR